MELSSKNSGGISFNSNKGKKQHFEKQTGFILNAKSEKITETKAKELQADYEQVVVHDFGDDYHLSEEEKAEKFQYYEAFKKVRRCKRKYRKLPEYVDAFRLCLDCLDIIANDNGLYPPQKFKKMVAEGLINVYGLNFPKYVGRDKKNINWEYVTSVIVDRSIDSSIFEKSSSDFDIDDIEDIDEYRKMMFGDMYDLVFNREEDYENMNPEDVDKRFRIKPYSESKQKDLLELVPALPLAVRDMKREMNRRSDLSSFVYEISESDFEYIERMDREKGIIHDIPKFEGNIMNTKDFNKYMYELDEYMNEKVKVSYRGKNKTPDEIRMIELKDALEDAGWNVRALYKSSSTVEKKEKKKIKEDKKKEKRLKEKLIAIQKRREKKEKGKGGKNKDKKKSKEKKKGSDSKKQEYKKEVMEYFDDTLLSCIPNEDDYEDFKDYKDDMLDFTSSNIS